MKKTLVLLATFAVAVGALAQGKVTFGNGPSHLIVIDTRAGFYKATETPGAAATQIGVGTAVMGTLTAQLWAGTAAGSLTLQSTLNPAGFAGLADGRLANVGVTLTGVPAGNAFFQVLLFETSAGSYHAALNGVNLWYGQSPVFQAAAGSFAPTPIDSMAGWAATPMVLSANIPEPSTFVLAGLGVASLLLFRRRK